MVKTASFQPKINLFWCKKVQFYTRSAIFTVENFRVFTIFCTFFAKNCAQRALFRTVFWVKNAGALTRRPQIFAPGCPGFSN
jgi:hypothetical protein